MTDLIVSTSSMKSAAYGVGAFTVAGFVGGGVCPTKSLFGNKFI